MNRFSEFRFLRNVLCNKLFLVRLKSDKLPLIYSQDINNHVKRIFLNDPRRCNALSTNFMSKLEDKLIEIENSSNADVKVLIIKSSSTRFSSGHDLSEIDKLSFKEHHDIFNKASGVSIS